MINENILLHYATEKNYNNDDQNVIGATTDAVLRTITSHNDTNCKYVKKFGTPYLIQDITGDTYGATRSSAGNGWKFEFRGVTSNTLLYTIEDNGGVVTVTDGSSVGTAEALYIKLVWLAGTMNVINGSNIAITTTGNPDAYNSNTIYLSGELTLTSADYDILFYVSSSGSTYYDGIYRYGGYRHTPTGVKRFPYFDIQTAYNTLAGAFTILTVLDSETYDKELTFNIADTKIQADLGQTPTITSGIGARITREVSQQYNNSTAIYFNKNGNDSNSGSWQSPKLTIANAIANRGANDVVFGGDNMGIAVTFNEAVTLNGAFTLESDYGYIGHITTTTVYNVLLSHDNANIYGFEIYGGSSSCIRVNSVNFAGTIKNCICYNSKMSIYIASTCTGTVENCICYNNRDYGIVIGNPSFAGVIRNCICYGNNNGIRINVFNCTGTVENCICYNNNQEGIHIQVTSGGIFSGTVENCICYNNNEGIVFNIGVFTGIIRDCISYFNTTFDLYRSGGAAVTITESDYLTNSGFTIGAGCITTDPEFCRKTTPYKFGISADSGAYRTDTSSEDMGAHLQTIIIGALDITINGFIIDGQNQYNNAISIIDTDNDTGLNIKWCSIYNFQGIVIDLYDDNTNIEAIIKNCEIYNNGCGIKSCYGGNIIEENLIYNHITFGIHSNYTGNIINHNIFYNNQYGIYFESNTSGIIIKNNIFHLNSLFDIYSETFLNIDYCCITGAVNNNVDISAITNITGNPLFINTNPDEENFHIKTIDMGYFQESPCKNLADDSKDIGAYDVDRSVNSESKQKYQLYNNPENMNDMLKLKGKIDFENSMGGGDKFGKAHKNVFPLQWSNNDDQTETQLKILKYISTLIKTRENEYIDLFCEVWLHLLPSQKLLTETSGIVLNKEISKVGINLVPNEFKGFCMGIKFKSDTGLVINAGAKTGTKAGAGWTVNQWTGYYVYHNYNYYLILSNTATVLTFSDPDDTLVSETIAFSIEKYFKIEKHTKDTFTLEDDDDELIDGTYDFYIDFIKCRVDNNSFNPKQQGYYYQKFSSKTGFSLTLEEK